MESPIHKGLIISLDTKPGYANVWIPTGKCAVPNGFGEYLYENSGGNLFGDALSMVKGSAYRCKIASPLTGGAWWYANDSKGASIFDDYDRNTAYDYRIMYNYQTHGNNGAPAAYTLPTDNPAATGSVSVNTLSVSGGNPTIQIGTMPKGTFPSLKENQWVLVAFINSSSNPVIFSCLHSDEAWAVVKK